MNRNFLTDAELAAMDLPLAMRAAACFSGLTDREIISRMGWEPRNGYRLLAPNDDYWPSVPACRVCAGCWATMFCRAGWPSRAAWTWPCPAAS